MIDQEDFLRNELRNALDSRTPDRTAMLNRMAANRADGPRQRPRAGVLRLAGSALAVVAVLGLGGVAKWAMAEDQPVAPAGHQPVTTAPSPAVEVPPATAPSSGSRPAASSRPPSTAPSSPPESSATPSPSRVRGHPGDTKVDKGSLSSTSAVPATGRSEVTLHPGADLTELELDIRVTRTDGLTSQGGTSDVPGGAVSVTVEEQAGTLTYHFVLKTGKTLTAGGTYVFSARYGGGARDAADDTYEAYATSVERKVIHIYGNFVPKD